jgi:Fe-S-cluster containining protein
VWNGPTHDCEQCGACCANPDRVPADGYVYLAADEGRQMKRLGLTVVHTGGSTFLGTRHRAGSDHPVCVALRGRIGGSCRCTVYESRPQNCRQFEVGGSDCQAAREAAGLPP